MNPTFNILPMFIFFFIFAGWGQELGWTGFLTPKLQARDGALISGMIRGILVGIWHLPVVIYVSSHPHALPNIPYGVWIAQRGFLIALVVMQLLILAWTIFFVWNLNNTKVSLLLVAMFHRFEIWLAYWMARTGIDPNNLANYWGFGMGMLLTAITIVIITGSQHLSLKNKRILC
jgi:hypothetical protein